MLETITHEAQQRYPDSPDMQKAYIAGATMNVWIGVDTPPEHTDTVLVIVYDYKDMAQYVHGEWYSDHGYRIFPTHWTPLP